MKMSEDVFPIQNCPLEQTLYTLQKCYFSNSLYDVFSNDFKGKQYVFIQISPSLHCVAKVYWKFDLHRSFYQVDNSVINFNNASKSSEGFPKEIINFQLECLNSEQLQFISVASDLKKVSLSIIFENVKDTQQKNYDQSRLIENIRDILMLFTLQSNSVVYLKNLNENQRLGIYCFIIHNIGDTSTESNVIGMVSSSTKINIVNFTSKVRYEQLQNTSVIPVLGGVARPYQILQEIITYHIKYQREMKTLKMRPCKQVLLAGPPGCGKTTLVHRVAADCGAVVVTLLGPEAYRPKPGDTEQRLREVFQEASNLAAEVQNSVCILLLDEVDSLCPRRNSKSANSYQTRATTQLLMLLDEADKIARLIIIATSNKPHRVDLAARRPGRLETEVYVGVPTEGERQEILQVLLAPFKCPDISKLSGQVAYLTPGYVGADLSLLCQNVALKNYRTKKLSATSVAEDWMIYFKLALATIRPCSLRGGLGVVKTQPRSLADIGGLGNIKQSLRAAVEWPLLHPQVFAKMGLPHPRGVLLYGPPGCAKTTIAQALSAATNTTFLSVSAAELYSPFVGDAERSIVELFHRARVGAPTILFIDEIDALVGSRGEREHGVQGRILSALLTEMDGVGLRLETAPSTHKLLEGELKQHPQFEKCEAVRTNNCGVIVIAATNRPDMLDDALLRPGRFDKMLYVPPPDLEARLDILHVVTSKSPLAADVDLEFLAANTTLFSGADIANLCKEAGLCALTEEGMDAQSIQQKHFVQALGQLKPSLSETQVEWYHKYKSKHFCK